ncbi:uncharacterized protein LOC111138240 [Crassostrea virginica]
MFDTEKEEDNNYEAADDDNDEDDANKEHQMMMMIIMMMMLMTTTINDDAEKERKSVVLDTGGVKIKDIVRSVPRGTVVTIVSLCATLHFMELVVVRRVNVQWTCVILFLDVKSLAQQFFKAQITR